MTCIICDQKSKYGDYDALCFCGCPIYKHVMKHPHGCSEHTSRCRVLAPLSKVTLEYRDESFED